MSITSRDYTKYFGFTHDEVKQMLMTYGNEQNEEVLNWSNTSSNSIVCSRIERADMSVKVGKRNYLNCMTVFATKTLRKWKRYYQKI